MLLSLLTFEDARVKLAALEKAMPSYLRPKFRLLILACGVLCVTTARLLQSQSLPVSAQQDQASQADHAAASQTTTRKLVPTPVNVKYYFFIMQVGAEDGRSHGNSHDEGEKVDQVKLLARNINLRQDEAQALYTIVTDGYRRILENDRDFDAAGKAEIQEKGLERASREPLSAQMQALSTKQRVIIEDTISRLKQELGQESFKKLDIDVTRNWGRGVWVNVPPGQNGSTSSYSVGDRDRVSSPEGQP
jgi:hypothetical protein